jgi:DNA-binding MarR family transcriptional regulator
VPPSTTRKPLLIDGTDEQFREFVDDFVRLSGRLRALRRALASGMGMTPPQYNILMILARADAEGVSMSAIAGRQHVSLSFVVSQMRRLERTGLVRLQRNPADRRSVLGAITRSGRARIIRAASRIQRVNDLLFASLTRGELRAMDRAIKRILRGGEAAALILKAK